MTLTRRAAARTAARGASRWATLVIGLAFPIILVELCWFPVVHGEGSPFVGAAAAVGFCAALWGIWVGSAALAGWYRGA